MTGFTDRLGKDSINLLTEQLVEFSAFIVLEGGKTFAARHFKHTKQYKIRKKMLKTDKACKRQFRDLIAVGMDELFHLLLLILGNLNVCQEGRS